MKINSLAILGLLGCLVLGHSSDVFAAGKGGSNGGDYLLLMKYANTVEIGSRIMDGVLPPKNARHYRYEFIRAARSGLRKLRSLLKSGQKFKYADGTEVIFNERTLKNFSYRINDLQDLHNNKSNLFILVESLTNVRGEPLTVQNYSDGRVELVAARWDGVRSLHGFEAGLNLQEGIAVHEILGIDEIERSDEYPVASAVLNEKSEDLKLPGSPVLCHYPSAYSFDFSYNWKGLREVKPGQSHGIINKVSFDCLGPIPQLEIGVGNIYSNPEGKSVGISTRFSSALQANDFIKNPVMARQILCAMNQFTSSGPLRNVELDREDYYTDGQGNRVTEYTYDLMGHNERQLVFGYYGLQQALAEAFKADQAGDKEAKAAALYHANTAVGEGLLSLDEALRLKKTPRLFIKYSQRALDHSKNVEYPRRMKEYEELHRKWEIYVKTGVHPDYNWFDKMMEKLAKQEPGAFKPRQPRPPAEPRKDALSALKACGYYNPELPENPNTDSDVKIDQYAVPDDSEE